MIFILILIYLSFCMNSKPIAIHWNISYNITGYIFTNDSIIIDLYHIDIYLNRMNNTISIILYIYIILHLSHNNNNNNIIIYYDE